MLGPLLMGNNVFDISEIILKITKFICQAIVSFVTFHRHEMCLLVLSEFL